MRWTLIGILVALSAYSAWLIGVELNTNQDYVRNYFTDIDGPVPFYAVNTTLSVFFLWATALVFAICFVCTQGLSDVGRLRLFFITQIFVFCWLGLDDRFKLHEYIAGRLGIGDHFILLLVGMFQVSFLILLGGRQVLSRPYIYPLAIASGLFVVMIVFDALVPHDMVLRLAIEDLAKSWANFFFLVFAWQLCMSRIDALKSGLLHDRSSVSIRTSSRLQAHQ